MVSHHSSSFFFFNDTATTEIYTLSLHDALPIWLRPLAGAVREDAVEDVERLAYLLRVRVRPEVDDTAPVPLAREHDPRIVVDRKSTRLNSSHGYISYAVFCLKKKKTKKHSDHLA